MKKDIKEVMEMLDGLEILGVAGVRIAKDGLGLDDIPALVDLAKEAELLQLAVEGAGEIPDELRDLDESEMLALIGKLFSMAKALKAAKV